ncbi:hypothetical protein A2397_01155 [Candidatus Amesbacteria bacterium RIFOXYB1_FULL_44_23]|uniref:Uncharacterized protein n=1 Tax=Candidatus Amesbacteria bacterium RIFOXYB1_FULL_44_23 TaxID=1797263 RepID=A0A1F4ZTJ0_9BACT|nr:MAG: hypothetical protein A2397_01155 [Candidatus Amesbacteria bacterium RIFOXYB1_FULL_44_23]
MKIYVTAKANKKKRYVEQIDGSSYVVSVKEPAVQGKANQAVTQALAEYFDVPKSQILLVLGQTSKLKIFEVPDHLACFEPSLKQRSLWQ